MLGCAVVICSLAWLGVGCALRLRGVVWKAGRCDALPQTLPAQGLPAPSSAADRPFRARMDLQVPAIGKGPAIRPDLLEAAMVDGLGRMADSTLLLGANGPHELVLCVHDCCPGELHPRWALERGPSALLSWSGGGVELNREA